MSRDSWAPTVEVVVPWRGGCPYREEALRVIQPRYRWPVTIAHAPAGPWCKANAVMPVVAASRADVLVVADADVWAPGVEDAVVAVGSGYPWAIPHFNVERFRLDGSLEESYPGIEGGGIVVSHRDILLSVPLDPRFIGWGQEDDSWGRALRTMLGPPWRASTPLTHYWHPPQGRATRVRGSKPSWDLRNRYHRAQGDQTAMRALLQEAIDALNTSESGVQHHSADGVGQHR